MFFIFSRSPDDCTWQCQKWCDARGNTQGGLGERETKESAHSTEDQDWLNRQHQARWSQEGAEDSTAATPEKCRENEGWRRVKKKKRKTKREEKKGNKRVRGVYIREDRVNVLQLVGRCVFQSLLLIHFRLFRSVTEWESYFYIHTADTPNRIVAPSDRASCQPVCENS